jgi:SAM-dependent methyltransferase
MDLPFPSDEFNVVTCTHIYEHVPDAQRMLDEIFRVLKPGGLCYFAAENRLRLWEGHYSLPLLSLLPKPLGHLYIKLMGKGERYYETHRTVWGLRKLTRKFEIIDYTVAVVREPEKYEAGDIVPARSAKRRAALMVLGTAYWAFPTYLWVLRKPRPVKG